MTAWDSDYACPECGAFAGIYRGGKWWCPDHAPAEDAGGDFACGPLSTHEPGCPGCDGGAS